MSDTPSRTIEKILSYLNSCNDEEFKQHVSNMNRYKEATDNKENLYTATEVAKLLNTTSPLISRYVHKVKPELRVKPIVRIGNKSYFGEKEIELFKKNMQIFQAEKRRSNTIDVILNCLSSYDDEKLKQHVSDIDRYKEAINNKENLYTAVEVAKLLNTTSALISRYVNEVKPELRVKPIAQIGKRSCFGEKEIELFKKNMQIVRTTKRKKACADPEFKFLLTLPYDLYRTTSALVTQQFVSFNSYVLHAIREKNALLKELNKDTPDFPQNCINLTLPTYISSILNRRVLSGDPSEYSEYILSLIEKDLKTKNLLPQK